MVIDVEGGEAKELFRRFVKPDREIRWHYRTTTYNIETEIIHSEPLTI